MDTDCRAREGSDWLGSQVPNWSLGNNLIHHLWWHRALLRLDLGEVDAVMASYDQDIRNFDEPMTKATPDHYVDLQNAAALLWRLEQLGPRCRQPLGGAGGQGGGPYRRGRPSADGAASDDGAGRHGARRGGGTVRCGVARTCRRTGGCGPRRRSPMWLSRSARPRWRIGAAITARVVDLLAPRQEQIRLLGGSNAQRDMFFQMLIDAAMKADRRDVVSAMIAHETATRSVPPTQRAGYAAAARWLM